MKFIQIIYIAVALMLFQPLLAQEKKSIKGTYALTNATIVTVTKGTIEKGTLVVQDGKIAALGADVTAPEGATVIDCTGQFIYPGMIDGGTRLGLQEISAVSLTSDYNEIGDIKPHMQALTAVNPSSVSIPVTRVNGVTTVLTAPSGGLISGTAALINLAGYTPEQMYAGFKGVVLNYPSSGRRGRWDRRSDEDIKKAEAKSLKKLNGVWDEAMLYAKIDSASANSSDKPEYQPQMEAMLPVLKGDMPLLVEVNKDKDILSAIKWVKSKRIPRVIFTGVAEGWRVVKELKESGIPVVTGPVLTVPSRSSVRYDVSYKNAGILQKAGIQVAIRTNEIENVRNLPYNAGFAAAYGMGKEEALKAITIVPAQIFGVADKIGSLEVGKNATLFVSTGDPFETKTQVGHLFIDGWKVSIGSRHTRLYEEFLERSPGLKK